MFLTSEEKAAKLRKLVESEGYPSVDALLQACIADSVSPGICTEPECDYTTEIEPDQRRGYCEACGGQTVQSALVLAGLIWGGLAMEDNKAIIRALKDSLRTTFIGGRVLMPAGVQALPNDVRSKALLAVRECKEFNEENDPHGEHDFGAFVICGQRYFWKIDYFDRGE